MSQRGDMFSTIQSGMSWIETRSFPFLARRYLATSPSMSLIPQLHSSGDSANLVKYILACPHLNIVQFAKFEGTAQCRKPGSGGP